MQLFNQFGYYGRPIPGTLDYENRLYQPELDYGRCIGHLRFFFPEGTKFCSVSQLRDSSETVIEYLRRDESLSGLLNGVHLPICLPQLPSSYYGTIRNWLCRNSNDYGTLLSQLFLPAFERAYCATFPGREFTNQVKRQLTKQLKIVPESRHQYLVERMLSGPVVGMYFPLALYGLSSFQGNGVMNRFPPHVLLGGGLDLVTTLTAYPDVFCRDDATPELAMAALNWQHNEELALSFKNGVKNRSSSRCRKVLRLHGTAHIEQSAALPGLLVLDPTVVNW